jgi:hypothetical protein
VSTVIPGCTQDDSILTLFVGFAYNTWQVVCASLQKTSHKHPVSESKNIYLKITVFWDMRPCTFYILILVTLSV